MSDINITTSGIDALLSNFNAHKAAGPDGIIARVFKEMHLAIGLESVSLYVSPCKVRTYNYGELGYQGHSTGQYE